MADAYNPAAPLDTAPAQQTAAELRAIKTRLNAQVAQIAAGANITLSSITVGGVKTVTVSAAAGTATVYNVKAAPYNAAGDNVTDDTAAIQAAINAATAAGGTVYFPPGSYYCASGLTVNESASTADFSPKASLIGDGPAAVRLRFGVGSFNGLAITGGTSGGIASYQTFSGIYLEKPDILGSAILIDNVAWATFSSLTAVGWDYGCQATDLLSSEFSSCVFRFNNHGFRCERQNFSYPNAITMLACVIGNNYNYGVWTIGCSTFNMFGGSVEGNGIGGAGPTKVGLLASQAGYEGAVGVNLSGVYFENNKGIADVWLPNSANSTTHNIVGCTFARISNVDYVTHNIYVETSAVKQTVLVAGCGFKSFNTYAPNSARQYINAVSSAGGVTEVSWGGCLFEDTVELPSITNFWGTGSGGGVTTFNGRSGGVTLTSTDVTTALGYTPGTGTANNSYGAYGFATVSSAGVLLRGGGISSVVRNAVGDYTINYAFTLADSTPVAMSAVSDIEIFGVSSTSVRVRVYVRATTTLQDSGFALVIF